METKPKLDMKLTEGEIIHVLSDILAPDCPDYHRRTEIIARQILNMMYQKTLMYGGDEKTLPLEEKLNIAFYEGIGRKAKRIPSISKRVLEGDAAAKRELVDTFIDIVGYGLMALNNTIEELQ